MDSIYSYRNKYSGKCVTEVSLTELTKLMKKLKKDIIKENLDLDLFNGQDQELIL